MPDAKPWYASKTIWFNLLSLGLVVLEHLQPFAGAGGGLLIGAAIAAGNALLRTITSSPISITRNDPPTL